MAVFRRTPVPPNRWQWVIVPSSWAPAAGTLTFRRAGRGQRYWTEMQALKELGFGCCAFDEAINE